MHKTNRIKERVQTARAYVYFGSRKRWHGFEVFVLEKLGSRYRVALISAICKRLRQGVGGRVQTDICGAEDLW